jgi:transcription elongation factor GreA
MINNKKVYVTKDGLDKIMKELEFLKLEERPRVISALKEARAQGDLSENAEYDAARTEQAVLEERIILLENMLENAEIVEKTSTDKVGVGSTVTIEYVEEKEKETYTIVGSIEADPFSNKISVDSPVAKAIFNKKVGDTVTVEEAGYKIKVLDIK